MKFVVFGIRPFSIVAEACSARTQEANDDEEDDWLGHGRRKRLNAGVSACVKRTLDLAKASAPNKNSALISGGAVSAPGVDLNSVEISPCKLSTMDSVEEVALIIWQQEFAQDFGVGAERICRGVA